MPRKINWKLARELYDNGWNDTEIANHPEIKTYKSTVYQWRKRNDLPPNDRVKPDERYGIKDTPDKESLFCNKEFVEELTGCEYAEPRKKRWWQKEE